MKKTYRFSRSINIPIEKAYHLAAEVEKYPEFIPTVKSARVLSEEANTKIVEIVFHHTLLSIRHIGKATFVENRQIIIRQIEGLGKNLFLIWEFEPVNPGTRISLHMEFESNSRWLKIFTANAVEKITSEILHYFIQTASKREDKD